MEINTCAFLPIYSQPVNNMGFELHVCVCVLVDQLCSTLSDPMDCSPHAPLSMGFSRQEDWSG